MESVSREDLLKLARRLQKKNKILVEKLKELDPSATPQDLEDALALTRRVSGDFHLEKNLLLAQEAAAQQQKTIAELSRRCSSLESNEKLLREELVESAKQGQLVSVRLAEALEKLKEMEKVKAWNLEMEQLLEASESNAKMKDEQISRLVEKLGEKELKKTIPEPLASPFTVSSSIVSSSKGSKLLAHVETLKLENADLRRVSLDLKGSISSSFKRIQDLTSENASLRLKLEEVQARRRSEQHEAAAHKAGLSIKIEESLEVRNRLRAENLSLQKRIDHLQKVLEGLGVSQPPIEASSRIDIGSDQESCSSAKEEILIQKYEEILSKKETEFADELRKLRAESRFDSFSPSSPFEFAQSSEWIQMKAELLALRAEVDELERSRARSGESLDYLKNVVLKLLLLENKQSERKALVPVIATILHFSPEELYAVQQIWKSHK